MTPTSAPLPLKTAALELVAASFVVLFLELALIRWLPGQVRVLAYFPNLILLSAFLGLGVGALRARARAMLWLWPVAQCVLLGAAWYASRIAFTAEGAGEHLWLLYYDLPKDSPTFSGVRLPIIAAFVLSAATFVPLGQIVAMRVARFRDGSSALWGYALDLCGSLLGVICFAIASLVRSFPIVWFGVAFVVGAVFFRDGVGKLALYAVLVVVGLGIVRAAEKAAVYSPYYALSTTIEPDGVTVLTNGSLHQRALDLRRSADVRSAYQRIARVGYHVPYRLLRAPPKRVLVLGAGTGNDVAVALDEGAEEVHVVEIDPEILAIGKELHPARPYDSPRVVLHNTDARAFLDETDLRFDLIVFGTIDSMTRLSALSNVRLDNFVYTEDSLKAARSRLEPDGGVVLMFMVGKPQIHEKLVGILARSFGEMPHVYRRHHMLFNRIYMAGPAFDSLRREASLHDPQPASTNAPAKGPTDDWPYLYLDGRTISPFYLSLMGALAAISLVAVLLSSREVRAGLRRGRGDLEMFLFGGAFLLLETRYVTEMSLVWGSTWITSAVVFGAILLTVLVSTIVMQLRPLPFLPCLVGAFVSLLLAFVVPPALLLGRSVPMRLFLSVVYVGVPIFFASACFALRFAVRRAPELALGWNLLGAVAGGLSEFFSMVLGLNALLLLPLVAYLGIALSFARSRAGSRAPSLAES